MKFAIVKNFLVVLHKLKSSFVSPIILFLLILSGCESESMLERCDLVSQDMLGCPILSPSISSISPNNGIVSGGTTLTINGRNFLSGATVTIGGVSCSGVTVVSNEQLTCITPVNSAGIVDIEITNPDGQTNTLTSGFTFSPAVAYIWTPVFNTDGDIGGVAGADAECVARSGVNTFNTVVTTHQALIASNTFDPRNIFLNDPPLRRPNGTLVANTYSDFFDPTYTLPNTGIPFNGTTIEAWTGLDINSSNVVVIGNTCSNWTSNNNANNGHTGYITQTGTNRIDFGARSCSSTSIRIICLSY